jgi:hypothetical protein
MYLHRVTSKPICQNRRNMKIILSYRRTDSAGIAGRIFDRFVGHFGADGVFMDIDNIPFGIDYREHIKTELENSDVVLVIMGLRWLNDGGVRRIDSEKDLVRIEIETALARGIPVIPVLVDGATMPLLEELPDSLRDLVFRNAATVDSGRDFNMHIDRLIRSISRLVEKSGVRERAIEGSAATPNAAAAAQDSVADPVQPHGSEAAIAPAGRVSNFEAASSSHLPHSYGDQTERPRSSDQVLTIRSARQVPVWIVAVAGCALTTSVWLTYRYVLTGRVDHAASEMASIFPGDKIEIKRKIIAPPPPPETPGRMQ